MNNYRHIFFDLDNTIWDFDRNSNEVLTELYQEYDLASLGVPSLEFFISKYKERNAMMWELYRLGKIGKEELRDQRFPLTFWDMGLDASLVPPTFTTDYLKKGPQKNYLFPHAHETLRYLKDKYVLHIITNGFAESQYTKMDSAELNGYFSEVIISEQTGYRKPDVNIFLYAMNKAGAEAKECLMIGDGLEVDIAGARQAGWDTVYFNPERIPHTEQCTYEIISLDELTRIL